MTDTNGDLSDVVFSVVNGLVFRGQPAHVGPGVIYAFGIESYVRMEKTPTGQILVDPEKRYEGDRFASIDAVLADPRTTGFTEMTPTVITLHLHSTGRFALDTPEPGQHQYHRNDRVYHLI